jgi:hypothetical protein
LGELDVKIDLIKENYMQGVGSRGINEGLQVIQIFPNPFEHILQKKREPRGQSMSAEAFVGIPCEGEIEKIGIEVKVCRGRPTQGQMTIASCEMYRE